MTKFYFTASMTLWATTVAFAVLFAPKVYVFYKQWRHQSSMEYNEQQSRKNSYYSTNTKHDTIVDQRDFNFFSFLKSSENKKQRVFEQSDYPLTDLSLRRNSCDPITAEEYPTMLLEEGINSVSPILKSDNANVYVEVQEVSLKK